MATRGRPSLGEKGLRDRVLVRLDAELMEGLRAYLGELQRRVPGLAVTQGAAIRVLLREALDRHRAGGQP